MCYRQSIHLSGNSNKMNCLTYFNYKNPIQNYYKTSRNQMYFLNIIINLFSENATLSYLIYSLFKSYIKFNLFDYSLCLYWLATLFAEVVYYHN